ncbi:MAG: hypothetical protein ACRDHZ_10430 [Ktedonobacteraceae bacterium]
MSNRSVSERLPVQMLNESTTQEENPACNVYPFLVIMVIVSQMSLPRCFAQVAQANPPTKQLHSKLGQYQYPDYWRAHHQQSMKPMGPSSVVTVTGMRGKSCVPERQILPCGICTHDGTIGFFPVLDHKLGTPELVALRMSDGTEVWHTNAASVPIGV